MLELAYLNQDQVKPLMATHRTSSKFKYLRTLYEDYDESISPDSWSSLQYVSKNEEGEILGYFSCDLCRVSKKATNITIERYSGPSYIFSSDLLKFIDSIFTVHNMNKITFNVIVGNPIEEMYDKYVEKYNGRVVGIYMDHAVLKDGEICDLKVYEIFKDNYLKAKKERCKHVS